LTRHKGGSYKEDRFPRRTGKKKTQEGGRKQLDYTKETQVQVEEQVGREGKEIPSKGLEEVELTHVKVQSMRGGSRKKERPRLGGGKKKGS